MESKEFLLRLRKEKRLSQAELAEELGITRQTVSRWESGLAMPSAENLIGLSRVYGMTVEEMYRSGRGEEPEAPPESENRDIPEIDEPKVEPPHKRKRIMPIILVVCVFLGTFFWGKLTNSMAFATTYLIWEAVFLSLGLFIKFVWRNRRK